MVYTRTRIGREHSVAQQAAHGKQALDTTNSTMSGSGQHNDATTISYGWPM